MHQATQAEKAALTVDILGGVDIIDGMERIWPAIGPRATSMSK